MVPLLGIFGRAAVVLGMQTEEEQLAEVMDQVGPFLAVGKPGESLPEVGAARIYVGDDEWQHRVSELMSQARLVVLRAGETANLWWEVKTGRSALRFNSQLATAHSNLALALHDKQDILGALWECSEALRLAPDFAMAHNNLGLFYYEIATSSRSASAELLYDSSHGTMYHATVEKAMEEYRAALRLQPDLYEAHQSLADALVAKGDLDAAISEYHECLRLDPGSAVAHNNLGAALERKGDQTGPFRNTSKLFGSHRIIPLFARTMNAWEGDWTIANENPCGRVHW